MGIKQTAANIVCGFIPDKKLRHRVRTRLNYDIGEYIDFARRDAGRPNARVRTYSGHGGMKKIIVVLDDEVAYKFPLVAAKKRHAAARKDVCGCVSRNIPDYYS